MEFNEPIDPKKMFANALIEIAVAVLLIYLVYLSRK